MARALGVGRRTNLPLWGNPPAPLAAKDMTMSNINQLEQTLITLAEGCLLYVQQYHAARKLGTATANQEEHFQENHIALTALVQVAHVRDSGLSEDARRKLLDFEETETLLLRSLADTN